LFFDRRGGSWLKLCNPEVISRVDSIILNESSVWSGGSYDFNRHDAWKCLPEARRKLFSGDFSGTESLLRQNFQYPDGVKGWWDAKQFGCYHGETLMVRSEAF